MDFGINLEFARSEGMSFEEGLIQSHNAGYKFIEAYVYSDLNIRINSHLNVKTESEYHHINTGQVKVNEIKKLMSNLDLQFSAMNVHTSLIMPQLGVPYMIKAIDLASEVACPIVMSDEGPLPDDWMPVESAFEIFCISLEAVIKHAQKNNILMAVELHNRLTTSPDMLIKLMERFSSQELGINFDTGNSFLAGNDPVEMLRSVADRVVHVHAKDIPSSQLHERGKVTGTRVGVAIGDGVIDFSGIISVLKSAGFDDVISVECDTLEQAKKSLPYLQSLL